jgi:hypothetical protein
MATDQELITQTVHDYFEGWYDADVARMDRALHAALVKRSPAEDDGAILKIDIADVCGDIASAVVRSAPYREYLHLIRTGNGWKIANALWLPQ